MQQPQLSEAQELLQIMRDNSALNLYLYDPNAQEHIVRCVTNEQAQKFLEEGLDFKSTFENALPFKGFLPKEQKDTQQEKFILNDPWGNNFVTHVEKLDNEGYKICGTNSQGKPRFIVIDKDGNATGFNGSKDLGIVERQMFSNKEAILKHFKLDKDKGASPQPSAEESGALSANDEAPASCGMN